MAFAEVGEVRLFHTDEGVDGPPMLFVHGYTCDSHDWSWQIAHFSATHRVIAVDLRGHGRSSVPEAGYDVRTFAADLAGLLQHLECPPVVAIGHSMGGLVASVLAVEHPNLVRALVAVDPGYLVEDATIEGISPLLAGLASGDPVPLVQSLLGASDKATSPAFLRTWHLRRVAGVPKRVLVDTLLNMSTDEEVSSMRSTGEAYLTHRQCPVLSIYADPARVAVETALFQDARSRSVAWPGSGHWLHQERPDDFNAAVEEWLASLGSSAAHGGSSSGPKRRSDPS